MNEPDCKSFLVVHLDPVVQAVVDFAGVEIEQSKMLAFELLVSALRSVLLSCFHFSMRSGRGLAAIWQASTCAAVGAASAFSMECSMRANCVRTNPRVGGGAGPRPKPRIPASGPAIASILDSMDGSAAATEGCAERALSCSRNTLISCRAAVARINSS